MLPIYPHSVPSLNEIDPSSFPSAKFSGDGIEKGQIVTDEDIAKAKKVANDLREMFEKDCAARMFLTEDMLRIADLRPKAIEQAQVAAVFPDPIGDRITNLETQTANMAMIVSNVPEAMDNICKEFQNQLALMANEMKQQFKAMDDRFAVMSKEMKDEFAMMSKEMKNEFIALDREIQGRFNGMTPLLGAQSKTNG